jgi:hypothetical protein
MGIMSTTLANIFGKDAMKERPARAFLTPTFPVCRMSASTITSSACRQLVLSGLPLPSKKKWVPTTSFCSPNYILPFNT